MFFFGKESFMYPLIKVRKIEMEYEYGENRPFVEKYKISTKIGTKKKKKHKVSTKKWY